MSGTDLLVPRGDTLLAGELSGDGRAVLLLHGLSATRRYVTMGSRLLERAGHRVIAYDARGHGDSAPAADRTAYRYGELVADAAAVLDATGTARAVLAGVSMGAHTALALALADPERVAGVVAITRGHDPETFADPARLAHWDALARGLREGGVRRLSRGLRHPAGAQRAPACARDDGDAPAAGAPSRPGGCRGRAQRRAALGAVPLACRARSDRGTGRRRRQPRRARPGASSCVGRRLRGGDPRREPRHRGAGEDAARLAGGSDLARDRGGSRLARDRLRRWRARARLPD